MECVSQCSCLVVVRVSVVFRAAAGVTVSLARLLSHSLLLIVVNPISGEIQIFLCGSEHLVNCTNDLLVT